MSDTINVTLRDGVRSTTTRHLYTSRSAVVARAVAKRWGRGAVLADGVVTRRGAIVGVVLAVSIESAEVPTISYDSEETERAALELARGCYQRDLLTGRVSWSGSGLRGKASKWSASYAGSRYALIDRLARKFTVERVSAPHGKIAYRVSAGVAQ